ncbi:MAG TPA: cupin domain-containing protein [Burkholderiaceae bacterium]
MLKVESPKEIAQSLTELWSPRVIGEIDDAYVKVAKIHGALTWHKHDEEDELFFILHGRLSIEMENGTAELDQGDMFIVPKGVLHNPIALEPCLIMLIERKSAKHTGDVTVDGTRSVEDQLRPVSKV